MPRLISGYWVILLLVLSACEERRNQADGPEQQITVFPPRTFSLARLDSAESFLDSLRALPRADSLLIRQFLTQADSDFIPNEVLDTVTTFHRYTSLQVGKHQAEVIAEITEFNTVSASLHLVLLDRSGRCMATVPLAFYYDEAGGKETWSSTQNTPTHFLQRREKSDFVYAHPEQQGGVMDPVGRGTTVINLVIDFNNTRVNTKQIDSTYTVTKY